MGKFQFDVDEHGENPTTRIDTKSLDGYARFYEQNAATIDSFDTVPRDKRSSVRLYNRESGGFTEDATSARPQIGIEAGQHLDIFIHEVATRKMDGGARRQSQ